MEDGNCHHMTFIWTSTSFTSPLLASLMYNSHSSSSVYTAAITTNKEIKATEGLGLLSDNYSNFHWVQLYFPGLHSLFHCFIESSFFSTLPHSELVTFTASSRRILLSLQTFHESLVDCQQEPSCRHTEIKTNHEFKESASGPCSRYTNYWKRLFNSRIIVLLWAPVTNAYSKAKQRRFKVTSNHQRCRSTC